MKLFGKFFSYLLILMTFSSCEEVLDEFVSSGYPTDGESQLRLEEISLPENTFSLLGEAIAFRSVGESSNSVSYTFNLDKWASEKNISVSGITVMSIYEDEVVEIRKLSADIKNNYCLLIDPNHTYLVYPSIAGLDLYETYRFLGEVNNYGILEEFKNEICERIYCSPAPFSLDELFDEIPGLAPHREEITIGNLVIGGLNRPNNYLDICDLCLSNGLPTPESIFPNKEPKIIDACSDEKSLKVVYERDEDVKSYGSYNDKLSQIYLWKEVSGSYTNLSNNAFNDLQPNASDDGNWIVFSSERPTHPSQVGIYLMKPDGSQQRHISGLFGGNPVFTKINSQEAEILFTSDFEDYQVGAPAFYGNIYKATIDLTNFTVLNKQKITNDIFYEPMAADLRMYLYPAGEVLSQTVHMKFARGESQLIPDDTYYLKVSPSGTEVESIGIYKSLTEEQGITMHQQTGKFLWTHHYRGANSSDAILYLRVDEIDQNGNLNTIYQVEPYDIGLGSFYTGFDYDKAGEDILASNSKSIIEPDFDVYQINEDLSSSKFLFGEKGIQERFPNFLEN